MPLNNRGENMWSRVRDIPFQLEPIMKLYPESKGWKTTFTSLTKKNKQKILLFIVQRILHVKVIQNLNSTKSLDKYLILLISLLSLKSSIYLNVSWLGKKRKFNIWNNYFHFLMYCKLWPKEAFDEYTFSRNKHSLYLNSRCILKRCSVCLNMIK